MTRWQWVLAAIILLELSVGAAFIVRQAAQPRPPVPDLSLVDEFTAKDIEDRAARCRTAGDWSHLAETLFASGYFCEAEACYRRAAKLAPQSAELLYAWGFLLSQMGRLDESNRQFQAVLELLDRGAPKTTAHSRSSKKTAAPAEPAYATPAHCWYFIGRNYLRLEAADKAAEAFRNAGDLPGARYELARILFRQEKLAQAQQVLEPVLAGYPRAIEPNILRHRIELALGHAGEADRYRERGDLAQGRLPTPFGVEWERLEKVRRGMNYFRQYETARELVDADKLDEAAAVYRRMLQVKWEAVAPDELAAIESQFNRGEQAVKLLQEILERQGPSTYYLTLLGSTLNDLGRRDEARRAWERAYLLHSQENLKDPCFYLAVNYKMAGDEAKSRHFSALVNHFVGVEKYRQFEFAAAAEALEKAVELDPALATSWFYLGEALRQQGKAKEARAAYEHCLKLQPENGWAHPGLERLQRS